LPPSPAASIPRHFNRPLPCGQPCVFPAFSKQFKAIQSKHFTPSTWHWRRSPHFSG
jgi:hypothetical protein